MEKIKIVSLDPGIRNLGYCVAIVDRHRKIQIIHQGVIDLRIYFGTSKQKIVRNTVQALMLQKDIFVDGVDEVIIEYQPGYTPRSVKIVETALHGFFITMNIPILVFSSYSKWYRLDLIMPKIYGERKRQSALMVKVIFDKCVNHHIADAIMQIVCFNSNIIRLENLDKFKILFNNNNWYK